MGLGVWSCSGIYEATYTLGGELLYYRLRTCTCMRSRPDEVRLARLC